MKLHEIRLQNFKCFENASVPCSKFTLLTGANSSGKSSILYGLLGAIQTKDFPLYFSPNGTYVTMGDFEELAFNHSTNTPFGVGFTLEDESGGRYLSESTYAFNRSTRLPKVFSLSYTSPIFSLNVSRKKGEFSAVYSYKPENSPRSKLFQSNEMRNAFTTFLQTTVSLRSEKQRKKKKGLPLNKMLEDIFQPATAGTFTFKDAASLKSHREMKFFLHSQFRAMEELFSSFETQFNFISSFRLSPDRTYYQKTKAALKVDKFGDNAIDQILEWENAKSKKTAELKDALRVLGLAEEIETRKYAGGRFDIRVVPADSRLPSSLCDVGFGVSQFLPILVANMQLDKGSTLVVSQPEIHLHPSIQANLADYFSDQSTKLGKQYILETHSEYLINRFRLLIAKERLKEEDVSAFYLGWANGKPTIHRMFFRKNGQIEGAPKDFFATYMMDVMDIAMNA